MLLMNLILKQKKEDDCIKFDNEIVSCAFAKFENLIQDIILM